MKVEKLISEDRMPNSYCTVEQFIEKHDFLSWSLRGTCFSLSEMRCALGIDKGCFCADSFNKDLFLEFLQYAYNCAHRATIIIERAIFSAKRTRDYSRILHGYSLERKYVAAIIEYIENILEKLNVGWDLSENSEIFLVYRNEMADVISVNSPDIAPSLYEYRRIDNRGNITRKAEILCTLAKDLELIEKDLKGTCFDTLVSDTTFLLNNADIRHNSEGNKGAGTAFTYMSENELENWQDKTYKLFLFCKLAKECLSTMKDIKEIKRGGLPTTIFGAM
jgi:hypothetical protein